MKKLIKVFSILIMLIAVSLSFFGCKEWEYDVKKNGIHFKKISRSPGGISTGYMTENHTIQGFPCEKGWIHFGKDWELRGFQLSENLIYKGTLLPSHTWMHFRFPAEKRGYVVSLPDDYIVQGYLCGGSGGYKGTHTAFYESGNLRSFFPPKDIVVDGVPCMASPFVFVGLYESGNIKACKLAEDYKVNGQVYRKGSKVKFDRSGSIINT